MIASESAARPSLAELLTGDVRVHDQYHGTTHSGPLWRRTLALSCNPYFVPVLLIRLSGSVADRGRIGRIAGVLISKVNYFAFGIEVARQTRIGPGLYLPHTRGTVIGAASIGENAVIYHGVTLGARVIDLGFHSETRPTVGNAVVLGAGAKIVGPISIGDGARVGPNAVVIDDVDAGALMVAPPAVALAKRPASADPSSDQLEQSDNQSEK